VKWWGGHPAGGRTGRRSCADRAAESPPYRLDLQDISARIYSSCCRLSPMPQRDPTVVLSLIDKLYAAALNGAAWADFLSPAADAVGADHAFVCQLDFHRRSLSYIGLSQARLHGSRTYRNYLQPLNIEYTMVTCLPVREGFSHDLGFTRTRAGTA